MGHSPDLSPPRWRGTNSPAYSYHKSKTGSRAKRDQEDFQIWRDSDCVLDHWDALVGAAVTENILQHKFLISRHSFTQRHRQPRGRCASAEFDQWIEVRGQNVNNPILCSSMADLGSRLFPWAALFRTVGETLHRGARGPTRSGENVRVKWQGTSAPDDECRANESGTR